MAVYDPGLPFKKSSKFAIRNDPKKPETLQFHKGEDYSAPKGTPIPSAANGKVYAVGINPPGWGNYIVLEHNVSGQRVFTLYAHLDQPSTLTKGSTILKNDPVGLVGDSGKATGYHLHFEVIKDAPNPLVKNRQVYNPSEFDFPDTTDPETKTIEGPIIKGEWIGGVFGLMEEAEAPVSPLILDLDGDGIEVSALNGAGSVYWDIDNDGFREASAWVGKDDGLLALDRNANGVIDNHSELFGTDKIDGFTVLTAMDSNKDNRIDSRDTDFAKLRIWQDVNSDGISQASELKTLAQAGIKSISLNDTTTNQTINGNKVTHISTFTKTNNTTGTIADVWFNFDNLNSRVADAGELDLRTLFLPTVRGYGKLADLHVAMSKDETLLNMVQNFTKRRLELTPENDNLNQKHITLVA